MRSPQEAPLATFQINPADVSALTASLRADASALTPVQDTSPPGVGPLRTFVEALGAAVGSVNSRASALREEAERLAGVMDATSDAATTVDARLGRDLGFAAGVQLP